MLQLQVMGLIFSAVPVGEAVTKEVHATAQSGQAAQQQTRGGIISPSRLPDRS
jgi:hypothetical protein